MALKAGYLGIKKAILDRIKTFPAIKTVGDGLVLADDGELSVAEASSSQLGGIVLGLGLIPGDDGEVSAVQVDALPAADESLEGIIYQYVGATDTYVKGHFYECQEVSAETYGWIDVSPGGSSGDDFDVTGTPHKIGTYTDSTGTVDRYRAVIHFDSITTGNWTRKVVSSLNIGKVVKLDGIIHTVSNGDWSLGYRDSAKFFIVVYDATLGISIYAANDPIFTGCNADVIIEYTLATN